MQQIDKIHQITKEPEAAEFPEKRQRKFCVSWVFIQMLFCILVLLTIVAVKNLSPEIYQKINDEYRILTKINLFTEKSELQIIHEE